YDDLYQLVTVEKGTLVSNVSLPTELWVNGVDILTNPGDAPMGVSYKDGVLTLKDVTIDTASNSYPYFGIYSDRALTIVLEGQNFIAGEDIECGICLNDGTLTLSGDGSLEVSGSDCGIAAYAGVMVEDSVSELIVSGAYGAFSTNDDGSITIGGKNYNSYDDLYQLVTVEKGTLVSNVSLPTELWVNGVNILANPGDAPEGVSYKDGVLTLKDVTIDSVSDSAPPFGVYSDRALTIVLTGQNSIAGEDFECGIYLDSGALTLSGDGSLEVSGSFYGIAARAGVTVEDSVSKLTISGNDGAFSTYDGAPITIGETEYDPYSDLLQLVTVEKGTLVSNVSLPTQLWVNGVNILTNPGDAPQGVSYDAAMGVLTLNGVTIDTASDSSSDSGIYADSALTIVLEGQNSIEGEGIKRGILLDFGALTLSGDGSLEVSGSDCGIAAYAGVTVEDSVSALTVSGPSGAFSASDGATITIGETEYDPYSDLFQIVTVEKGTLVSNKWLPLTELWVNGVDILDPSATLPTGVSYNTETGVLTLENVAIDPAEPYYNIIYADSALTIELKGKNSLVGEGAEYGIYLGNGALTLSGDGSLEVSGNASGIAAFAGVTVEDSVSELTVSGPSGAFSTSDGAPITIGGKKYDPSDDLYQLVTVENGKLVSNEWLPLTELWVNGVNILAPGATLPEGVSYEDGVLTLNNAAITQGYLYDSSNSYSAGIYANGSLSIVLKGSSSIAAPENGSTFFDGIAMYSGSLNISGDGSLAITALGGESDGIYLQESSLIMKDCTLDITADYDGIYSDRSVTLTGCTLDIAADDDGIYCSDSVTLTDCTLDITADYDGLYSDRSVTLTDCTLDIAAGDDGIDCYGSATLTGCTLDIAARDDGITCYDSVTLTGCTLNIAADYWAISASEDIRLSNGSATVSSGVSCFSSDRLLLENNSTVLFCNNNAVDANDFTLSGGSLTLAYGTFVRKTPTLENQPEIVNNGYLLLQDTDALQQAEISGTGILSFDNAPYDRFFDNAGSSIVSQDSLSLEVGTSDENEGLGYSWKKDENGNWVLHLTKPMFLQSALTITGEQNGDSVVIRTDSLCRIDNLSLEGDSGLSVTFEGSAPLCVAGFSNECPVTSLTVAEGAEVSILDGFSETDAELTVDGTLAIWGISAKKLTVGAEGQLFLLGNVGLSLTGGAGALTLEEGAQLSAFCDTTALFLTADKTLSPQEVIVLPEGYLPEGFELCRVERPGGDGIFTAAAQGKQVVYLEGNERLFGAAPSLLLCSPEDRPQEPEPENPTHTGSGSSGSPSFSVSLDDGDIGEGGSVTADSKRAARGDTIVLTVSPDEGYVLEQLTVKNESGTELKLTDMGDGKFSFTMPAGDVSVLASFVKEQAQEAVLPFTDVEEGAWYYDAVAYVYDKGMMTGVTDTTFEPDATTTRGMIVTMLYRLEGEPAVDNAAAFADVAAGAWYEKAVAWASQNGIVNGYGDDLFGPNDAITREQMAAILFRYAQYKGLEAVTLEENLGAFEDAGQISEYAVQAFNWVVGQGLMTGVTDTTLEPASSATRAQVATILMRYCEALEQ
ncbi:MAG TPA: S-layer homology domain-containing protein, partial [Candidatus Galloscillospira excrementipullorum]|nr:S-layer homology domain-containing protein [Candidatus Galloscillospira excrementipullorum]